MLACLASMLAIVGGLGSGVERALQTTRDQWRTHAASGSVAVVEIDKRSIDAVAAWPWPRRLYADAIDRLHAAGARTIAFDVDFSAHGPGNGDTLLAAAIRRADGSVILPTFQQQAGYRDHRALDSVPIPVLRDAAVVAGVNVLPDIDGVVRHYQLGVVTAGLPRPAIGAMLAEVNSSGQGEFPIDYAIDPDTIDRISFVDVVRGRVDPARVAGKRILIGATAIELNDRYPVPHRGMLPGVVLHALAAETLIQNGVPWSLGPLPLLFVTLAAMLAIARVRHRRAWLVLTGALSLLLLLAPFPFEGAGIAIDCVPALFASLTAAAAALAINLADELRRRRYVDLESGLANAAALHRAAASRPQIDVVVARFDRLTEMTAALGTHSSVVALQQVAARLAAALGTTLYRVDAGTLAWVTDAGTHDDAADDHFAGLLAILRPPVQVDGLSLDVRPTFGIASGAGGDAPVLVAGAIVAARRIRESGGRWDRFIGGDGDAQRWQLSLLGELSDAMATGAIWVAYQPKFGIADDRVVGVEALVRWKHPTRGTIPPDTFIPLVEAEGRAAELTDHVMELALAALAQWQAAGIDIDMAINLSATLLDDPDLVPSVRLALDRHGIAPDRLTLELTESAIIASADTAGATLARLRALGVKLSIDDYGTGQSTLSYLKRVPASELKIDKSFVQGIAASAADRLLVQSTVQLAHALGLKVVAEGVEDQECLDTLAAIGCDTIQGWLIGRPVPADEIQHRLSTALVLAA